MQVMLNESDIAIIPAKESVTAPVLWVLNSFINGQLGPSGPVTHLIEVCPMTVGGKLVPRDADNNSLVKATLVTDVFAMMARCPEYELHITSGFAAISAVRAILAQDILDAEAAAI